MSSDSWLMFPGGNHTLGFHSELFEVLCSKMFCGFPNIPLVNKILSGHA